MVSIPLPLGIVPLSISVIISVYTRTHALWVQVWTDMGKDTPKNTHGLPMSFTSWQLGTTCQGS